MTDRHILWHHAKGALILIAVAWVVLTLIDMGFVAWADSYPKEELVPWAVEWAQGWFENLQSEAWQVGFAAYVFKHFLYKGSPESK